MATRSRAAAPASPRRRRPRMRRRPRRPTTTSATRSWSGSSAGSRRWTRTRCSRAARGCRIRGSMRPAPGEPSRAGAQERAHLLEYGHQFGYRRCASIRADAGLAGRHRPSARSC
jgi:hypothetical protein